MRRVEEKEAALERKNRELEERKRLIEQELKQLGSREEEDLEFGQSLHEDPDAEAEGEGEEKNQQEQGDIIGQLQAVKRAAEQRNQGKLKQLRKRFESNQTSLERNRVRLEKLEGSLEQAEQAVKIKNELKRDLEGKGKKISEESRKWISQISKLNDKHEELKRNQAAGSKEQQSLKTQLAGLERRLADLSRERSSYEGEGKALNGRLEQLKLQIEGARTVLKDRQVAGKEDVLRSQKDRERIQVNQKRVERQKNELIKAYKKLGQYIALLRKTNTHLQTANSLGFSLKEYLQAIDKTDLLPN